MANETILSGFVGIGNAISALMSPAFVNASVGLNLVTTETFADSSNVLKFRKSGALTAEALAEATAYTYSSSSVLTDASVSLTASKGVVASKVTVEALRFGTGAANLPRVATEHGEALARLFDTSWFALFSSITNAVTAATTLTKDNLLDAVYNIQSSMKGAQSGRLAAVLHWKGKNEIEKELTSISAPAFSNPRLIEMVGAVPQPNGFVGTFGIVDVYASTGMPTASSDNVQCVFHPMYAFAAGLGGSFETQVDPPNATNGYVHEVSSWMFYSVGIWNNTAACKLASDV